MVAETFGNGECQKETASQQHNGLAQNLKRFICSIDVIRRGRNCVYVTNDSSSQYAVSSHEDPHKEGGRDEASYVVLWKITTLQYC